MKNILKLAKELAIEEDKIIPYGWDKAKIALTADDLRDKKDGKYVLVTSALNANAAGEGKTSTEIGLNDALRRIGVNSIACLREPSQGVSYGNKGPAHGALKARVIPDAIDYHFTGDIHALTYTINSIAAQIDNVIYQGNELNIDPDKIVWNRAIDICDRALRDVTVMQGDKKGTPHKCEFVITVAHELSTIATLATSEEDFINRTKKAIVAYTFDNKPVTVGDLHMTKAIRNMMHEALMPNLVQSLEENPVFIAGLPFANISIGTNAVIATKLAQKLADVVLVESGFGSDCGGEKNLDLVCSVADINPSAIVAVCSCRSLKLHGGQDKDELDKENVQAVKDGLCNLEAHINHLCQYNLPLVIAINRFSFDTDAELKVITDFLDSKNCRYAFSEAPLKGSEGSVKLAETLMNAIAEGEKCNCLLETLYKPEWSIKDKISAICKKCYGTNYVEYSELAEAQIADYEARGYSEFPICISKTPASITEDPKVLGAPKDFTIHIREVRLFAGAGFIVPLSGSLLMLPGLGKVPRLSDSYTSK